MAQYAVEETVRLTVTFTDKLTNLPVNPTTVTLTLIPPGSGPQVITDGIVNDSTGVYHYDLDVNAQGQWLYRWQGTGTAIASSGNNFFLAV